MSDNYKDLKDAGALAEMLLAAVTSVDDDYEQVAASQTNQVLGPTGAVGDFLKGLLVVPSTTSPGAVSIKDGGNTAITVFTGGTVSDIKPIWIPLGIRSTNGAWQVTTVLNESVVAVGNFT